MSFAQSSPLCHLYRFAKGEALHPHIEIAILGSLPSFVLFDDLPIKMAHFKKKKRKVGSHPI